MHEGLDSAITTWLQGNADLSRLAQSVALGEGFQLLIVINDSPRVMRQALPLLTQEASRLSGASYTVIVLEPAADGLEVTTERLLDGVLTLLVHSARHGDDNIPLRVIIGADASSNEDMAWSVLFRRMNERRNTIINRTHGVLLLCVSQHLFELFAHEAPDFWSIRSAVITLPALIHMPCGYNSNEARTSNE